MAKSFKTSQNALSSHADSGKPPTVDASRAEFSMHLREMMDMDAGAYTNRDACIHLPVFYCPKAARHHLHSMRTFFRIDPS